MNLSFRRRHAFVFVSISVTIVMGITFILQEISSTPVSASTEAKVKAQLPNKDKGQHSPKQSLSNKSSTVSVVSVTVVDAAIVPTSLPTMAPYERTKSLDNKATILIQLSGEMANNLFHIAHGVSLQLMAKEEFNIDCNLVLRHQDKPKWKSARDNIQQCFPKLSGWNFEEGNINNEISLERQNLQLSWLQEKSDQMYALVNSQHLSEIRQGLKMLSEEVLRDADRPWIDESKSAIRVPYLYLETLDVLPMIDHYYDHLRDLLVFNDTACCALRPESADSVFHFRNFESELTRGAYEMGFAELSPVKVATELFGRLQPGDRVQITTRTFNQKARNYAEALEERGINASVVTDQSSVQDFCFLKQAQKELVGGARSTFFMWAALLGDSQKGRVYLVDNRGLRGRFPDFWERFTYNFTHPRLRDRLFFELYREDK